MTATLANVVRTGQRESPGDPSHNPSVFEAEVKRIGPVFVSVPGYDPDQLHGPCHHPPATPAPAVGDKAWVMFSDKREAVIVAWEAP
jgi:hypothetical protein